MYKIVTQTVILGLCIIISYCFNCSRRRWFSSCAMLLLAATILMPSVCLFVNGLLSLFLCCLFKAISCILCPREYMMKCWKTYSNSFTNWIHLVCVLGGHCRVICSSPYSGIETLFSSSVLNLNEHVVQFYTSIVSPNMANNMDKKQKPD